MFLMRLLLPCWLALPLAACAAPQISRLFTDLDPLQRVWVDEHGSLYSAIQEPDGNFTVHDPALGVFYDYHREAGQIMRRPSHTPSVDFVANQLVLGDKALVPANVILGELYFSRAGTQFYGILTIPLSEHPVE